MLAWIMARPRHSQLPSPYVPIRVITPVPEGTVRRWASAPISGTPRQSHTYISLVIPSERPAWLSWADAAGTTAMSPVRGEPQHRRFLPLLQSGIFTPISFSPSPLPLVPVLHSRASCWRRQGLGCTEPRQVAVQHRGPARFRQIKPP